VNRPQTRVPQVNLLVPPQRGLGLPVPGRVIELGLFGLAMLAWAFVAVAVALLLGWHPTLGLGP